MTVSPYDINRDPLDFSLEKKSPGRASPMRAMGLSYAI
jgi:hypothetical protein